VSSIDPIRSDSGEIIGFAKVTRDMTEARKTQEELKRAREQLFQAQKLEAVGQLTGGVAHDFNNLLTIIIGNIEIALRNAEKGQLIPAQQTRLLGNALMGAKRAATLTQRLLAFARRQPLDPKPMNVNKFIAGIGEFLQRILGESIHVEAVGSGGLWPVEVDAVQLESAILNLALNARDAMPNGGKLTVEAANIYLDQQYGRSNPEILPGQYVMLAVSDTGTGMESETLARAFRALLHHQRCRARYRLGPEPSLRLREAIGRPCEGLQRARRRDDGKDLPPAYHERICFLPMQIRKFLHPPPAARRSWSSKTIRLCSITSWRCSRGSITPCCGQTMRRWRSNIFRLRPFASTCCLRTL
jgi:signal transduction histidine kinase